MSKKIHADTLIDGALTVEKEGNFCTTTNHGKDVQIGSRLITDNTEINKELGIYGGTTNNNGISSVGLYEAAPSTLQSDYGFKVQYSGSSNQFKISGVVGGVETDHITVHRNAGNVTLNQYDSTRDDGDVDISRILYTGSNGEVKVGDLNVDNGYTIFPIWAEESADLAAGAAQEWAFGNGDDTPITSGIVVPINCELFAMGLNIEGATATATVRAVINGDINLTTYQVSGTGNSSFTTFPTPLSINPGDRVNFRTITSSGANTNSGRVVAWFRVRSSSLSTSVLNDLLDVSANTPSVGQVLSWNGANWAPVDPGLNSVIAGDNITIDNSDPLNPIINSETKLNWGSMSNTNITTNLNASTSTSFITTVPWGSFLGNITGDVTPDVANNQFICNFTGTVELNLNMHLFSTIQRSSVQARFRINGSPIGPIASTGYIRSYTGHNESSLHISSYHLFVNNGDTISVGTRQEALGGTVTFAQSGTSRFSIKRLT